jgi:hypothetical protein
MNSDVVVALVWVAVIVGVVLLFAAITGRGSDSRSGGGLRPGPGTVGTVYDMLNEDKRKAVEMIVEEKAGARDPEDKDGNLPDLDDPRR